MPRVARLVAAVTGALLVAGGPVLFPAAAGAVVPRGDGTGGCDRAPEGRIAVLIIIDFGDLEPDDRPEPACVVVPRGATGADVLEERARLLGTAPPRYNASGLLCAIDGLPDSGCGALDGDRYLYWSYWHGTAEGWDYADIGPSSRQISATGAEGWHFIRGAALPGDPPPRIEPFASPARPLGPDAGGAGRGADDGTGEAEVDRGDGPAAVDGGLEGLVTGAIVVLGLVAAGMWMVRRRARSLAATAGGPGG